jgi:DNA invertase Pin-like site-specific DNA recombinase
MTKKPSAFVAYLRVSTVRQGESGLGLEAQRAAVEAFARQHGGAIVASYVKVETGKRSDRPKLAKALCAARKGKATLLIAKLDRLARDVAFNANLMDAGVEFLACDQPFASRLTLHILAAVAEDEARRISERTKAALQAARRAAESWVVRLPPRRLPRHGRSGPLMRRRPMRRHRPLFARSRRTALPRWLGLYAHLRLGASRPRQAAPNGSLSKFRGCWPHDASPFARRMLQSGLTLELSVPQRQSRQDEQIEGRRSHQATSNNQRN